MRLSFCVIFMAALGVAASACAADTGAIGMVPWPKSVDIRNGAMPLSASSRIVAGDPTLSPLAEVLSEEIFRSTGLHLAVATDKAKPGDISLALDASLKGEANNIFVDATADVRGGNYRAVAWGTATLLQAIHRDGQAASLPKLYVKDEPTIEFRSVMLDLARRWHPVGTVKDTIELLRLYKIRYLHLHLSDDQSFTFSSASFPKLATPGRSYTPEEMADIVRFADERGVTIIPEIDVPGHCSCILRAMPEVFGNTGTINMVSETAYDGMDKLIGDLCDTFKSSPYIHLGADETGAGGLKNLPEYMPYVKAHGLRQAAGGDPSELFTHFVVRMNEMVKKRNRTMIVWNGFPSAGTPDVRVPKQDIIIMAWQGSPMDYVRQGFRIINCCWLPLYIVPTQGRAPTAEMLYAWNEHESASWENPRPVQIPLNASLLGAQICVWEQRPEQVIPMLASRAPAFSERLWNPSAGKSYEEYTKREDQAAQTAQRIIYPVKIAAEGLLNPGGVTFEKELNVTLQHDIPGTVHYLLAKPWEEYPTAASPAYDKPIVLDDTMTISAQLFDDAGKPIGGITQMRFSKVVPAYKYRVMGPAPLPTWPSLPDFTKLKELQSGITGLMTPDRGEQINHGMFAGLDLNGHIDVRVEGLWNPYAIELTGQIRIPIDGQYTFKMRSNAGQSAMMIGRQVSCETKQPGAELVVKGTFKAGTYALVIHHDWREAFNDLNIQFTGPNSGQFEPLEKIVLPMSQWVKPGELSAAPSQDPFSNPTLADVRPQ